MALHLRNLTAGYDRHPAIHHLNAEFPDGSLTAIVGPNGGGKSTLLKAIMGFVPLMSGHVARDGLPLQKIGYLPQQSEIDRSFPMTVVDVVRLGHWPRRGAFSAVTPDDDATTHRALARVGLAAFARRPIAHLSTGQFQRVLFARLLVQDASLVLLDEPFAAIDSRTTADLLAIVRQWHQEGRTVIAVLHDIEQVRACFPQAVLLARDIVASGPVADSLRPEHLLRASLIAESWQDKGEICARPEEGPSSGFAA